MSRLESDTVELIAGLENRTLYTVREMVSSKYVRGHKEHEVFYGRLSAWVCYHEGRDRLKPDKTDPKRYYGRTVKTLIPKERLRQCAVEPHSRVRGLLAVALVLLVAGVSGSFYWHQSGAQGIASRGIDQIEKEREAAPKPRTPWERIQDAWVDYRASRYEVAERKAFAVLSEDITDHERGDALYLLGEVRVTTGKHWEGLGHFSEALGLYDRSINRYLCQLGRVKAFLGVGDLDGARASYDEAWILYENSPDENYLDVFFSVGVGLFIRRGDFEQALLLAKNRHELIGKRNEQRETQGLETMDDDLAGALSDLGLLYAVSGNWSLGFEFTVRSQGLIRVLGDDRRHYHNQYNFVFLQRCMFGEPDLHLVQEIEAWSKMNGDIELEYYLNLALTLECEGVSYENHHSSPPKFD